MQNPHNQKILKQMLKLNHQGLSSRKIAEKLGVSKSSVNTNLKRLSNQSPTAKYLFLDIETAPDIAVTFKRFKANLNQDNILQDGGTILSISWRWLGEDKAQGVALTPQEALDVNDKRLCAILYGLIEQADVVIGHNIDNFDLPCIKARLVINRFAAPKKVKTIDTLKIARQMRFPSNRLGSLGVILGEGDKASHSGISTWIGCLAGNQSSLDEMLVYNIEDVDLLYRVYMRLRNHDSRPLNAGLFTLDEKVMCPVCGSHEVEETGNTVYTTVNEFKEYECNDCGSRSRSRTAVSTKQKRKTLLA
jgi:transposase-like protein